MCVSINNERGAKHYINEWLRSGGSADYAKALLRSWQPQGWLTDHEITDRELVLKAVKITGKPEVRAVKAPKITGKPGVRAVKAALKEQSKLPAAPARRERVA